MEIQLPQLNMMITSPFFLLDYDQVGKFNFIKDWLRTTGKSEIFIVKECLSQNSQVREKYVIHTLGIQIRNMKMDFNFHGTWCRVTLEKRMMKIYDFFYSAKSFSHPI